MIGYSLLHYDKKKSQYLRSDVVLAWASLGEWEVTLLIHVCPVDHLNSFRVIFTSEVTLYLYVLSSAVWNLMLTN